MFFTLGHEFVHVSQNQLLSGLTLSQFGEVNEQNLKEFFAYKFENSLGSKNNPYEFDFNATEDYRWLNSIIYDKLNYTNFKWTTNTHFPKIF